jgi:hypothetical protein
VRVVLRVISGARTAGAIFSTTMFGYANVSGNGNNSKHEYVNFETISINGNNNNNFEFGYYHHIPAQRECSSCCSFEHN